MSNDGHPILLVDTFDGAKPRFLNRGKKRRSVLTLSIPRASARGVKWVDDDDHHAGQVVEGNRRAAAVELTFPGFSDNLEPRLI